MSGRGHGRGPRGQGRGAGRGRQSPQANARQDREPSFRGSNPELPSLNFGASIKDNKPIEFLQTMGEHSAIHYKPSICNAFWSTPPEYGPEEEEPDLPDDVPAGIPGNAILAVYLSDYKEWKSDSKKIAEHKKAVFALVYAQLSESSRAELKDDEEWTEAYNTRDLLFLIVRIRATHIARQSGNPGQDREQVNQRWSNLQMQPNETSFAFRKRVEDHQLERASVGLAVIPEEELVIGILNRLDMSRYASLTKDYFDNERRGIADLPDASSTLWKEIKDTQIIRYRSTAGGGLESIYLSRADELNVDGGRGRGRGGGRSGRGRGRGRGRGGRGRGAPDKLFSETAETEGKGPSASTASITPDEILCWACGKKGHRSSNCPVKKVSFAGLEVDETVYYSSVQVLQSTEAVNYVFHAAASAEHDSLILLDTQSSIHLLHSPAIAINIQDTESPVTVQGITGNRVRITQEATIKDIGIQGYYSPRMTANIISYHKVRETHSVYYYEDTDTFVAEPSTGPTLTFSCLRGHYVMDMGATSHVYAISNPAKYSARQLASAKNAYEFIARMGYISFKGAADIIQRGCMKDIDFTRADLVNAQSIYGTPAATQLGQGTQRTTKSRSDDQIPLHESVPQELQVDLFYFLGHVFLLSISVLLGLIMVTHLGAGHEKSTTGTRSSEGPRSKAGKALLLHISQYKAKGFHIRTVTTDGEGAIKASRTAVEELGTHLNILGHGSHTPHAEAAIRHVKNKARSTLYSLPFPLPSRLAPALIAFVVHTVNMVPKQNAPGHLPAYTAFRGRSPSYKTDTPFAFGTTGFLQRAQGSLSNTAAPRADYCLWLGTTRNLKGTHRCLNLGTLTEITGDNFRPAPLTQDAIQRLRAIAGTSPLEQNIPQDPEPPLPDPNSPYALDPNRGVDDSEIEIQPLQPLPVLVPAETATVPLPYDIVPVQESLELTATFEQESQVSELQPESVEVTEEIEREEVEQSLDADTAMGVTQMRNDMNSGYNLRKSTNIQHVYSAMTIKAAASEYGQAIVTDAVTLELKHCISKHVFKGMGPSDNAYGSIPSKMFLTPKRLPSGALDKIKARLVAGGHRQDRSLYSDQETSSPTVSLTAVFAQAALAAHRGEHVLTLDHKAAYLNAKMKGPEIKMMLSKEVSEILCDINKEYKTYRRANGTILVQLQKALYGCIQSAVLWYEELSSTLEGLGYSRNPYDTCVFNKIRGGLVDTILVYVDDLMLTSTEQSVLDAVAEALRVRYGGVTVKTGKEHDFLGIHWDFRAPGKVSLSMDGYVSNIVSKYNVTKKAKTPATEMLF